MAHTNTAMQSLKSYNLFLALSIICGLLADALKNNMVGPLDRKAVNKAMGFLLERLAVV